MPTPHILVTRDTSVLTIEFARRDKKNAITADMYAALGDALELADTDTSVHAVLLRGQPDLFTAGNDLADFLDPAVRARGEAQRFLRIIAATRTPIVAAVGGLAVGIGVTMLMHCDVVIAADDARFQLPFVSLGLCPEGGSSLLLPQLGGHRAAAALLMLGDWFDASTARNAGIVTEVVPAMALMERAQAVAARLAAQPRDALRATKALLRRPQGRSVQEAIDEELRDFERLLLSDTARGIFRAFLERSRP